jgi:hypothetical protein
LREERGELKVEEARLATENNRTILELMAQVEQCKGVIANLKAQLRSEQAPAVTSVTLDRGTLFLGPLYDYRVIQLTDEQLEIAYPGWRTSVTRPVGGKDE